MKLTVFLTFMTFFKVPLLWGQEAKQAIEVFPSTPFYQYIIYESLAIFWIAIIGLIIIIRMKLREIERVQKLGLDKTDHSSIVPLPLEDGENGGDREGSERLDSVNAQ